MRSIGIVVALGMTVCVGDALGASYTWVESEADPQNFYTNAVHFRIDGEPVDPSAIPANAAVVLVPEASIAVRLPDGADYSGTLCPAFRTPAGSEFRLDLAGASWTQTDTDAGNPYVANQHFGLTIGTGDFLQLAYPGNVTKGLFRFENALLTVTNAPRNTLDFRRGTFDFLAPNGTDLGSSAWVYLGGSGAWFPSKVAVYNFHKDAHVRMPILFLYGEASTNELNVLGGRHYVRSFWIRNMNAQTVDAEPRTHVHVTGPDTELVIGDFQAYGKPGSNCGQSYRVDVDNGASLSILSSVTQRSDGEYDFVFNDARLYMTNGTSWSCSRAYATNTTVEAASLTVVRGFQRLKDVTWNGGYIYSSGESELSVAGGTMTLAPKQGGLRLANGEGLDGTSLLRLTDGVTVRAPLLIGGLGSSCYNPSQQGVAALEANGATLIQNDTRPHFINYLNSAKVGAKGLVIAADYAGTMELPQAFANLGDEAGVLTLAGSCTKSFLGSGTTVSTLVLAKGRTVLGADTTVASRIVITNGAVLAAGPVGATGCFTGLSVGDAVSSGTLEVAAGETIAVNGPVELQDVRVALSGDFTVGAEQTVIRTAQPLSAESARAWGVAVVASGLEDGYVGRFWVESSDGLTELKMKIVLREDILVKADSGETEDSEDRLYAAGETLTADVAGSASLTMSGSLGNGALVKTGAGRFSLIGSQNLFAAGILTTAGLFSVPSVITLGPWGKADLTLAGGTFEYVGDGSTEESLLQRLHVNAPVLTDAVVIKTDSPLCVSKAEVESGSLLKRGVGCLTFAPSAGSSMTLSAGDGTAVLTFDPQTPAMGALDEDGASPTTGYMGFGVVEGEVRLAGTSNETVAIHHNIQVGLATPTGTKDPVLTIDGVRADICDTSTSSNPHSIQIGSYYSKGGSTRYFGGAPLLNITNGANVRTARFIAGRNPAQQVYPTVTVDRASWTLTQSFCPSYNGMCKAVYNLRNGAEIRANKLETYGSSTLNLSGSSFLGTAANGMFDWDIKNNEAGGTWNISGGACVGFGDFKFNAGATWTILTLNFNGGTWRIADGKQPLRAVHATNLVVRTRSDEGLALEIGEGATAYVGRAITGTGGVVKTGAGKLVFETQGAWNSDRTVKTPLADPVTVAFGGALDVRAGEVLIESGAGRTGGSYRAKAGTTVDFAGAVLENPVLSGAGTFRNATFVNPTIALEPSDSTETGAPTFDSVTLQGRVLVDFGRTEGDPIPLPCAAFEVLHYTGVRPDVSAWRVVNAGLRVNGGFAADAGTVTSAPYVPGLILIVR